MSIQHTDSRPIGVFDSGIGGLSVLRSAMEIMPNERFIFLGDFANSPYGSKPRDMIESLSIQNAQQLIQMDIKSLLIACNTATSAAAHLLRERFDLPIVGLEPALKPAAQNNPNGLPIAVLATPQTLRLEKFDVLYRTIGHPIVSIPCPGLSKLIENDGPGSVAMDHYLREALGTIQPDNTAGIVLGCTHFSFIAQDIRRITGPLPIYDGRFGTARQLKRVTPPAPSDQAPSITLRSNPDDAIHHNLLQRFMAAELLNEDT